MKSKICLIVTALLTVLFFFFFFYPLQHISWLGTWNVAKLIKYLRELDGFLILGIFVYFLVAVSILVSVVHICSDDKKTVLTLFGLLPFLSAIYPTLCLFRTDYAKIYFLNEKYIVILLLLAVTQLIQWTVLYNEK